MRRGRRSGFTLVELVIVVAVLGILTTLAVPKYTGMRAASREAAVRGTLGTIRAALAIQYAKAAVQTGTAAFPESLDGTIFTSGSLPADPITGQTKVVARFDDTGGWVYDSATGAVTCNLRAYRGF